MKRAKRFNRLTSYPDGFLIFPRALLAATELSIAERVVLLVYMVMGAKHGKAWPGSPSLAEQVGLDIKTVQSAIKSLTDRGLIEKTGTTHQRAIEYSIVWDKIAILLGCSPVEARIHNLRASGINMVKNQQGKYEPSLSPELNAVLNGPATVSLDLDTATVTETQMLDLLKLRQQKYRTLLWAEMKAADPSFKDMKAVEIVKTNPGKVLEAMIAFDKKIEAAVASMPE